MTRKMLNPVAARTTGAESTSGFVESFSDGGFCMLSCTRSGVGPIARRRHERLQGTSGQGLREEIERTTNSLTADRRGNNRRQGSLILTTRTGLPESGGLTITKPAPACNPSIKDDVPSGQVILSAAAAALSIAIATRRSEAEA